MAAGFECHHVIAHWVTEEDRQRIAEALEYARSVGDLAALPLLIAQLTQPCEAREQYRAAQRATGEGS